MTRLETEVILLKEELIAMGAHVEKAVADTFLALRKKDMDLLASIILQEELTNEMEKNLENKCFRLLATRSPRASDFRLISGTLKIITDLERIGDHTQDISEILRVIPLTGKTQFPSLQGMYELVSEMLQMSMDALVREDVELARAVSSLEQQVDQKYVEVREKIIGAIRKGEDDPEFALDIMQIAKYLERMGDHGENIAEWVIYIETGNHPS